MERVVRFELCRGGSLSQPDDDAPGVQAAAAFEVLGE